ncbi:MAG: hypothetical protein JSV88_33485 [Candidatus Aminicenantes bacterium]|nr:MAG: hypothetical protein JSV88_33485 [Candidatus Aminicenantes bacterium]
MKRWLLIVFLMLVLASFVHPAGEDCPKTNVITKMSSSNNSFKAVQPLDFSKITSGGAMLSKNGKKVAVCLSNGNFTTAQMSNIFVLPIKKKEEFIALIRFSNGKDKIVPGTYSPTSGFGKPFWVYAEVALHKGEKGVIASLGVREGTATIIKMTEDMICGKFHLKTKTGSSVKGEIAGEFNVKLEKSKW